MPLPVAFLLTAAVAGPAGFPGDENLVRNPGFETVAPDGTATDWTMPTDVFALDEEVVHSGRRSLRLRNADPGVYRLATQPLPFEPNRFYDLSVWIRTEKVEGEDYGASLCVEWSGDAGYIGGTYPPGFKGTNDWQHWTAQSAPVPPTATRVHVVLYLRQKMTGTAWFDDVEVKFGYPPPLTVFLLQPTYRGQLYADASDQRAILRATIGDPLRGGLTLGDVELRCAVRPHGGGEVLREDHRTPQDRMEIVTLDLAPLPVGAYALTAEMVDKATGDVLGEQSCPLTKSPSRRQPGRVLIDEHNRTLLDGEPFFPLGVYEGVSPGTEEALLRLDTLAGSPFNTVMNYGINGGSLEEIKAYLDAAHGRGLKIIYSLKDFYEGTQYYPAKVGPFEGEEEMTRGVVTTFRDHPAILAWYLNDELPLTFHDRLRARYEAVRELDPNHPTWIVLYQVGELERYLDTTDVLGTDPYPIPRAPLTMAADWTKQTVRAVGGRRAVWMVPQWHDWSVYDPGQAPRAPTREEVRNMAFQCLIHGANGLIFYSYFDLKRDPLGFEKRWADVTAVGREIRALIPVLLSTDPPPPVRLAHYTPHVHFTTKQRGRQVYLLAVNTSPEEQTVTFRLPPGSRRARDFFTRENAPLTELTLTDTLAPLAVRVYEIDGGGQRLRLRK